MDTVYFIYSANSPTLNNVYIKNHLSAMIYRDNLSVMTKCITKAISVIDKSTLLGAITIIGNKLSPITIANKLLYLDKCPSLATASNFVTYQ